MVVASLESFESDVDLAPFAACIAISIDEFQEIAQINHQSHTHNLSR